MNADHDLERRLADYYTAEAPARAPDWVLARALDAVDDIPQRRAGIRLPWRFPPMNTFAKLAVAAIAVVAVGAIGLASLGSPRPGPDVGVEASPSPLSSNPPRTPSSARPELTEVFYSDVHGLSVKYPDGWEVRPATEPWTSDVPQFDQPFGDHIVDPAQADHLFLGLYSRPLGDQSVDQWADDLLADQPDCGPTEPINVDRGFAAGVLAVGCLLALVEVEGRGYLIELHVSSDDPRLPATYDLAYFREILAAVRFTPESAWVRPALTETYTSEVHGISISYPAGWKVEPATEPWTEGVVLQGSPFADTIYEKETDSPFIALASQPLEGRPANEWAAEYLGNLGDECDGAMPVTVDGAEGLQSDACGVAMIAAGDRGYLVSLYRIPDRGFFDQILATVTLRPEDALDAPASGRP